MNTRFTLFLCALLATLVTQASNLPVNFAETRLATGLDPTSIEFAPDGRLFVTEKAGRLRIIKNGALLAKPFLTLTGVDNNNERGLQKVVFDPAFASNHYFYIYYTVLGSPSHNRVSRFTASGDTALPGSEQVLIDLPSLNAGVHNGGCLLFSGGKLFITVGENGNGSNAQSFTTTLGKILRINTDGSIPTDNPYYTTTTGQNRAIYALGFRNPFKITSQNGTGKIYVNDVGNSTWEEINQLFAGKNYGWPGIEGKITTQTPPANYQDPVFAYNHSGACSITGGAFYNPTTGNFPASYAGKYFYEDYCGNYIKTLDTNGATATFATGLDRPIDVKIGPDGALYYLSRGGLGGGSVQDNTSSNEGEVWRVTYTGSDVPTISADPISQSVSEGGSVTLTVGASGTGLSYRWQRNGANLSNSGSYAGVTTDHLTISPALLSDSGAAFRAVITNANGSATSNAAILSVTKNKRPTAHISSPANGTLYKAGTTIAFTGTGTDPEDGASLPAADFSWTVVFHHLMHTHPGPLPTLAADGKSGTFDIPNSGETSSQVFYRLFLKVTDSKGAFTLDSVDLDPQVVTLTFISTPANVAFNLDGQPHTTTYSQTLVSGIVVGLTAPATQEKNGDTYTFVSWNPAVTGGQITVPDANTSYTVSYTRASDFAWRWLRRASSAGVDRFNRVRVAPDGNLYAAGAFSGTASFDGKTSSPTTLSYTSAGGTDGMLARYSKAGDLAWVARFASTGDDEVLGLATDKFGYAYVSGFFTGTMSILTTTVGSTQLVSAGGKDAFVAKIHPDGHVVYAFRFGAASDDQAAGVDVAPDLRFYVAGSFVGNTTVTGVSGTAVNFVSRGNSDAFLAKFSDIGTMYWTIQAGGAGNDFGYGAAADITGGGYLMGSYEQTAYFTSTQANNPPISKTAVGGSDGFVLGVSVTGRLKWVSSMGGTTNENVRDVAADPRGTGLVAVGGFSQTASFGSTSLTSLGFYDAFATRLDTNGAFVWATRAGGTGQDQAWGVRLDKGGNALVAASFSGSARGFGGTTTTLTSQGGTDALLARLVSTTGATFYQTTAGGTGDDQTRGVDTAVGGTVLAAGVYGAAAKFGTFGPYADAGLGDGWVGRYATTAAPAREGVAEAVGLASLKAYPNPARDRITIEGASSASVTILDGNGRVVVETMSDADGGVNTSGLANGVYLLQVQTGGQVGRLRFVISR